MKKLSAGRLINELSRAAHVYFQHEFKKYRIGHAQIRTLFYVAQNEGKTQKELAEYLNLDKSSITSQLQLLERNGYIKRKASEKDARKQVIAVTDRTRKILPEMQHVLESWTETLLDGFDEEERKQVFRTLIKMSSNAKRKLDEIYVNHNQI